MPGILHKPYQILIPDSYRLCIHIRMKQKPLSGKRFIQYQPNSFFLIMYKSKRRNTSW